MEKEEFLKQASGPPEKKASKDRRNIPGVVILNRNYLFSLTLELLIFAISNQTLHLLLLFTIHAGLTLLEATDFKTLSRHLEALEKQYNQLSMSHRTRYAPKEQQDHLKSEISSKVQDRDGLQRHVDLLRDRQFKLRVALEAAHAYNKIQPPHQTIGDAILLALASSAGLDQGWLQGRTVLKYL